MFLGTFDMDCRWRGQGPDSRNTQRPHTHADPSPPSAAAARSEMETDFSFDVLHCFPPVPTTLTRFTSAWSVALQSHPAQHDPKLTQEGGGGGVGVRETKITPEVPVRGRNRTRRKVPSVLHLNPPLPPPCQWLSALFRFINAV